MSNAIRSAGRQPASHDPAAARFGGISRSAMRAPEPAAPPDYRAIVDSSEFRQLRIRFRVFVLPMSVLFLGWYLAYVIVAAYAPSFMATPVFGLVNVGLLMGFGQFASTVLIALGYHWYATRRIDPRVADLRANPPRGGGR